jgi:hypothetical protein
MQANVAMQGLAHPGPLPLSFYFSFFSFLPSPRGNSLGRPISFRKTAQRFPPKLLLQILFKQFPVSNNTCAPNRHYLEFYKSK